MFHAISATTLVALIALVETNYLSPCEDYLLQREISPAPRVIHAHDSPQYKTVLQTALANPNINSLVKVDRVEEFLSQRTPAGSSLDKLKPSSVRGYHYHANFSGSLYGNTNGACYFEWIMVPFVPAMPMVVTDVACTFDAPQ